MYGWERITSQGRLVYWRRGLPDRQWIAVSRKADGRWHWAVRRDHRQPLAEGTRSTSRLARDAADRHVQSAESR